jgi:hypothetical protein
VDSKAQEENGLSGGLVLPGPGDVERTLSMLATSRILRFERLGLGTTNENNHFRLSETTTERYSTGRSI